MSNTEGTSYANSANCTWTICPSDAVSIRCGRARGALRWRALTHCRDVSLRFVRFALEGNYDFLRVQSFSRGGVQTEVFTGAALPGDYVVSAACVTVVFTSDNSVTQGGFELAFAAGENTSMPPTQP